MLIHRRGVSVSQQSAIDHCGLSQLVYAKCIKVDCIFADLLNSLCSAVHAARPMANCSESTLSVYTTALFDSSNLEMGFYLLQDDDHLVCEAS